MRPGKQQQVRQKPHLLNSMVSHMKRQPCAEAYADLQLMGVKFSICTKFFYAQKRQELQLKVMELSFRYRGV